jgi:hypothetical protein
MQESGVSKTPGCKSKARPMPKGATLVRFSVLGRFLCLSFQGQLQHDDILSMCRGAPGCSGLSDCYILYFCAITQCVDFHIHPRHVTAYGRPCRHGLRRGLRRFPYSSKTFWLCAQIGRGAAMAGSCDKEGEEEEEEQAFLQDCGLLDLGCEHWDRRSSSEDDLDLAPDSPASRSSSEGDLVLGASRCSSKGDLILTGSGAGLHLEVEAEAPCPKAANGWVPGWNCGPKLLRKQDWHTQAFVLVVNVYLALQRLPREVLQSLTSHMDSGGRGPSLALKAASGLLRLSATSIWRAFAETRGNNWELAESHHQHCDAEAEDSSLDSAALLSRLTRVALGVRDDHGSAMDYQKWLCRLETEGVSIGDKYHSMLHFRDCIFLSARTLQCLDEDDRRRPLGGLGISSNFALLFDGVPMGGVCAHGRHGTVQVICLNSVSPHTGRLHAWLATWVVQDAGHSGQATAEAMYVMEAGIPLNLSGSTALPDHFQDPSEIPTAFMYHSINACREFGRQPSANDVSC